MRKLQKIQNFAARVLTGTRKYEHITPVMNNLRWLSVPAMLALYDAILTFKCLRGLAPKYLSSRFNTCASVHGRNTRNKNMLDIPAFNTAAGQRSFIYRAVKCWNMQSLKKLLNVKAYTVLNLKLRAIFYTAFK